MYNKVFLIGNLTRDAELRYTSSGIPVAHFTLAVNRIKRKDAGGEGGQDVDFINIVAWRRLAEICGEYLKKGMSVAIEGRLQIRTFEGRDGQKKTMTEVVADTMQMLGKNFRVKDIERTISLVRKVDNAKVGYSFLYDLPYFNQEHILGLLRLVPKIMKRCDVKVRFISLTRIRIYPLIKFYDMILRQGEISP